MTNTPASIDSLLAPSKFSSVIGPDQILLITIACRLHNSRRGVVPTDNDFFEYIFGPSDAVRTLRDFCWDDEVFPLGSPDEKASRDLTDFEHVMGEKGWSREECAAWLRDYWWLKGLLDEEAERIVGEVAKSPEERAEDAARVVEERRQERIGEIVRKGEGLGCVRSEKMKGNIQIRSSDRSRLRVGGDTVPHPQQALRCTSQLSLPKQILHKQILFASGAQTRNVENPHLQRSSSLFSTSSVIHLRILKTHPPIPSKEIPPSNMTASIPQSSPPPYSPPPVPPSASLTIRLALRMHDCRRGGAGTGDDGHEYLNRELGTDFYLDSFFADKRRFPPEQPRDGAGRHLLEQFQALMCKHPRWRREECDAWLRDYWWVKGLLDREAKRIAEEAVAVADEEGRETGGGEASDGGDPPSGPLGRTRPVDRPSWKV